MATNDAPRRPHYAAQQSSTPSLTRYVHEVVTRRGTIVAKELSEAEAEVIAFALNAVAAGKHLVCWDPELSVDDREYERYTGPTDGIW